MRDAALVEAARRYESNDADAIADQALSKKLSAQATWCAFAAMASEAVPASLHPLLQELGEPWNSVAAAVKTVGPPTGRKMSRIAPIRSFAHPIAWYLVGLLLHIAGVAAVGCGFFLGHRLTAWAQPTNSIVELLLGLAVLAPWLGISYLMIWAGMRLRMSSQEHACRRDRREAVLYLRSFADDSRQSQLVSGDLQVGRLSTHMPFAALWWMVR